MAVIKLRRIQAERTSQTINAGELTVAGTKLYYGAADTGVSATGLTPTQVAGTNIDNLFNQSNIFKGSTDLINTTLFQDAAGTTFYKSLAGRLQTVGSFTFNSKDLVDRAYVDNAVSASDAMILKGTVNASTGAVTFSDGSITGKFLVTGANSLNTYLTG
jgi:hypothetical protein